MAHYLLLIRSITYAQRMSALLERAGITAYVFRPPLELTERGCGYALKLSAPYFSAAMRLLKENGLRPVRVFFTNGDGSFSEITF